MSLHASRALRGAHDWQWGAVWHGRRGPVPVSNVPGLCLSCGCRPEGPHGAAHRNGCGRPEAPAVQSNHGVNAGAAKWRLGVQVVHRGGKVGPENGCWPRAATLAWPSPPFGYERHRHQTDAAQGHGDQPRGSCSIPRFSVVLENRHGIPLDLATTHQRPGDDRSCVVDPGRSSTFTQGASMPSTRWWRTGPPPKDDRRPSEWTEHFDESWRWSWQLTCGRCWCGPFPNNGTSQTRPLVNTSPHLPQMPPKLHLKFKGITPKTARLYRQEINRFFLYVSSEFGSFPKDVIQLDDCMADFINMLYQEGESVSHAGWLLSGFKRFLPTLRRELVTAQQYYNNWIRDHIPVRAVPMPWSVAKTLAAVAYDGGHTDIALLLILGLSTADIHLDRRTSMLAVTLQMTKTARNHAQTLALQNKALVEVVQHLLHQLPEGKIWAFTPRGFRLCFGALLEHCQPAPCSFSVYSLRRGGATDAYVRSRSLDVVVTQGRWKDQRTARIYLDDARAALQKMHLPEGLRSLVAQYRRFWCLLLHR